MINEVRIKNFKSVQDLTLQLGRFNILIGANGSGKSNILEAIAFGGAASADRLDNEFLSSRGIRPAVAQLMKNAFSTFNGNIPIELCFKTNDNEINFTIDEKGFPVTKWLIEEKNKLEDDIRQVMSDIFINKATDIDQFAKNEIEKKDINNFLSALRNLTTHNQDQHFEKYLDALSQLLLNNEYSSKFFHEEIANYLIYSPEISSLRKFDEEGQILPLGIKGEGIFNVLQIFNQNYDKEILTKLKKYLNMLEWFDDFNAVYDKFFDRKLISVKDRYLPDTPLNQTNVNEGFLFLLFYASLFVSEETPTFFAIDNIEASFHPKLCEELIRNLVVLSKEHNKQVILTTHNPFVLDGLNLNDEEQSLFVVRRNSEGETIADKIKKHPKNIKLSEAWMRGYIGGNPETF